MRFVSFWCNVGQIPSLLLILTWPSRIARKTRSITCNMPTPVFILFCANQTPRCPLLAKPTPARSRHLASARSEEHTSELQSRGQLVCRLLLEKKKEYHTYGKKNTTE